MCGAFVAAGELYSISMAMALNTLDPTISILQSLSNGNPFLKLLKLKYHIILNTCVCIPFDRLNQ